MSSILSNIPSLRLRKDIWTHFPVILIRLPFSSDSRDRYAVQWHKKNLIEWSQSIPHYTAITQVRLLKALKTSDKWTIECPQNPADLCVIAMRIPDEPRQFDALPDIIGDSVPAIHNIDDVKTYFPVCWKSRNNRHTLEYHNTQVRALAEKMGVTELEVRNVTFHKLLAALSTHWEIAISNKVNSHEICTIVRK